MRIIVSLKDDTCGSLPECPSGCRGGHELRLWTVTRKAEAWGHFATVMLNGARDVIDGSLPHVVDRLPRGARPISSETVARYWHEDNESHVFGGPNVAKALRKTIAAANRR